MTPTARPPLTTNHYAGTKDVAAHRRAILRTFADLYEVSPREWMTRREAQTRAYGTDKAGATSAASAVGWLLTHRLIERTGSMHYRITEAGRRAVLLDEALAGARYTSSTEDEVDDFPTCMADA